MVTNLIKGEETIAPGGEAKIGGSFAQINEMHNLENDHSTIDEFEFTSDDIILKGSTNLYNRDLYNITHHH